MYRLIPRSTVHCRIALGAALIFVLTLTSACASKPQEVRDTPTVEVIRLNITKVRNAIEETRATIAVSRGAPYLPEFYVRLAELLSEEAKYHYQLAFERENRSTRALHVPQVRLLKEDAIGTYELVLSRFPDSPLIPRVLFNIGHEHRELGNFDEMRKVLDRLVDNYPDSPLRGDALLVLGDYHFDRNELDPAQGYYERIASAPIAPVSGLGHYKLAWVWVNKGECRPALDQFERAIERSNEWQSLRSKIEEQKLQEDFISNPGMSQQDIDVRREALVDLSYCYSRRRKAEDSVDYLRKMAYNRSTYVAALYRLANRYRTMDQFTGAMLTTRELLRLGQADIDRLDDARTLYTAVKRLKDYRQAGSDAELIARALTQHYTRADIDEDHRKRLHDEFEVYVRDLATTAQKRMNDERRKSGSPDAVARAYEVYADTFKDSPQRSLMLLNWADVLGGAERDLEAGLVSMEAADIVESDNERRDALYDALVYFQESLSNESDRDRFERVTARSALRRAGGTLLTYTLSKDREKRVKFAIAQAYYDEGLFTEAIDKLTAVAYEFPESEESDAAIKLALDSYRTLNDYDGLMYASRRFMSESSPASGGLKTEIKDILAAAEQRKLDELSLNAAGDEGGDLTPLLAFAEKNEGTELGERALINAFVAARAIGDTDTMYTLADSLAKSYPKSEQLPGIYTSLAQTAVARFDYDTATRFLRRAADVNPAQRTQLLVAAAELNEQLGNADQARSLFQTAIDTSSGQAKIDALSKMAQLVERSQNARKIIQELEPFEDLGEPETMARLGLARVEAGDAMRAEGNLQLVLNTEVASAEAQARAHYGMAEVMLATLRDYPTPEEIELIEEFVLLIEVTQQSYLNAARQGSLDYTAAALGRLAFAMGYCADRLEKIPLPSTLSAAQKEQVRAALQARAQVFRDTATEALEQCGNLAWSNANFTPVVRQCLQGKTHGSTLVPYDAIRSRQGKGPDGLDDLRGELSRNPEDIDRLSELATRFLEGGDPHSARLVLARAVQVGGGPDEQNLLGVASYAVGDIPGAFEAFSKAAEGGLEAGRKNLATLFQKAGLAKEAGEVNNRYQEGRPGGRLIK